MTEQEIAAFITGELMKYGVDDISTLVVASGNRSGLPNVSASDKKLENGEILRLDIIAVRNAYQSDVARTLVAGEPSKEHKEMWQKLVDTYYAVLEKVRPGARTRDLYNIYKNKFESYGLPVSAFYGHGLGLTVHEEPYISEYFDDVLEEGMVLCLEPFLFGEKEGYQLENEVIVTKDGFELITDITSIDELPSLAG